MIQTASQNITKPTNIHEEIERYLQKVFENELNTRDSVLVSYNPFVIKKIAGYLSGRIKMPASIGIAPSWDIFTGGAKLARYRINKYEYKKSIEKYEKTVLTSIQEVNDAMVSVKTTKANLIKADEAYSIEKEKHNLAEKQFTIGDSSKLDEMKSNVNLLIVKQHEISSKIDNVISTISLYNAVGGIDYTKPENL